MNTTGFSRICGLSELPPDGEVREFSAGGRQFCVANCGGAISALDNVCPHRGGPLGQGMIEDGKVICPWHAWAFDLHTGVASHSASARVAVFPVKIEAGQVLVGLSPKTETDGG